MQPLNRDQLLFKPLSRRETVDRVKPPGFRFIRLMREITGDPNGFASFQMVPDAISIYTGARELAGGVGVPTTWDFFGSINVTINVPGFEVQQFAGSTPAGPATPNLITPPKPALD